MPLVLATRYWDFPMGYLALHWCLILGAALVLGKIFSYQLNLLPVLCALAFALVSSCVWSHISVSADMTARIYVQSIPWEYFTTAFSKRFSERSWRGLYFQAVIVLTWYLAPAYASWLLLRIRKQKESSPIQWLFIAIAIVLLFLGPAFANALIQGAWHEKHFSFD